MKYICFIILILFGCSGLEQSEKEKVKHNNVVRERIYRKSDEKFYSIAIPPRQEREKYPWEESFIGLIPKITKDFFRCKGSSSSLAKTYTAKNDEVVHLFDCRGSDHHSLPMDGEKEFIYPILIELLNYLQTKTGKKVVVTCGHRCPLHNQYSDQTPFNQSSKHLIGAEVDFYIQGMEEQPEEIVKLLMQYYTGKKEYEVFNRYKDQQQVAISPWYNKEIMIKHYQKSEGRDVDNRHPYPYISIQVRFDKEKNEKVIFSHEKANKCFQRF